MEWGCQKNLGTKITNYFDESETKITVKASSGFDPILALQTKRTLEVSIRDLLASRLHFSFADVGSEKKIYQGTRIQPDSFQFCPTL